MASLKEIFWPTKGRIVLTLLLFVLYFVYINQTTCYAKEKICLINAEEPFGPENFRSAKQVPFSCAMVCTDAEYVSASSGIIVFTLLIPLATIYVLSSLVVFGFSRLRK